MEGNVWYGYTKGQWVKLIACYLIFFFFGAIESSQSVYYFVPMSLYVVFEFSRTVQGAFMEVRTGEWSDA